MRASTLNRLLRRRRRHLAALAVVFALSGAVAVHHLATHEGGMGTGAMVVCLAVVPVVAAAAVAVVGGLLPRPRFAFVLAWAPARVLVAPPLPRPRSSPVATVVLRC